jgi:hypothetical protein
MRAKLTNSSGVRSNNLKQKNDLGGFGTVIMDYFCEPEFLTRPLNSITKIFPITSYEILRIE